MDDPDLYAYVGEDELGSGEVGLKAAFAPAGFIPIVATSREKVTQEYIRKQLQGQARKWGKQIRLVRYVAVEVVDVFDP